MASDQQEKEKTDSESLAEEPIERHTTAAWRGHIEDVKPKSQVAIPDEESIQSAKEWVDSNSLS